MPEEPPRFENPAPEDTAPKRDGEGQTASPKVVIVAETAVSITTPPTGKRQSVSNIARQLNDTDLQHLGVVKLIIENLDRAEMNCDVLEAYVDRFHDSDKKCAVYSEKLNTNTAIEVAFGVGVGLGCAIIGLTPTFWDGTYRGPIVLGVGILFVLGGVAVRIIKR